MMIRFTVTSVLFFACVCSAQPWQPMVIWDREGATDSAHYGYNVFPLGDQNQDGFDDFGIYAGGKMVDGGSTDDFPRVEFYHGGNPPAMTPYFVWTVTSTESWELQADEIGDFNGDGNRDWMIRRPDVAIMYYYYVYFGGPAADTIPDLTFYHYLSPFYTIGDYNGDGFDDLWYHDSRLSQDVGYLFLGSVTPDTVADLILPRNTALYGRARFKRQGDINGDGYSDGVSDCSGDNVYAIIYLGSATPDTIADYIWSPFVDHGIEAIVNDLNGDGFDEMVAENRDLHYGRDSLHPAPDLTLQFPGWFDQVASAGDVNGDGFNDLAGTNMYAGPCWGYAGGHLGGVWQNPEPTWLLCGGDIGPYYPRVARGVGDVNGDEVDDIIIGGTGDHDIYLGERGRVMILAGDDSVAVESRNLPILPDFRIEAYPNPFNGTVWIEFETPPQIREMEIMAYNLLGQVAFKNTLAVRPGRNRHALELENQPSGYYFLKTNINNNEHLTKLLLLK